MFSINAKVCKMGSVGMDRDTARDTGGWAMESGKALADAVTVKALVEGKTRQQVWNELWRTMQEQEDVARLLATVSQ